MTDTLKDVLNGTKRIEAILEEKFGSTGRGLYAKMDTANMPLPEPLQKRIRYVATLRNKTMHQDGFEIDNIQEYVKTCQSISEQLEHLHANHKPAALTPTRGSDLKRRLFLICCAGAGIFALAYLGMATALKLQNPAPQHVETVVVPTSPPLAHTPPPTPTLRATNATVAPKRALHKPAQQPSTDPHEKVQKATTVANKAPTSTDPEAIHRDAPLDFSKLKFSLGNDGWGRREPKIVATFKNNHTMTIASARVEARLFINGEKEPVAGTSSHDGVFYVFFGDGGLASGQSMSRQLSFFGFDKETWKVPDILNAKSHAIQMRILSADDGRKNKVQLPQMDFQP